MARTYGILGWTLRALALGWIVSVVLLVATAAEGFTTAAGLLPAFAFHAVCAVSGIALVAKGRALRTASAPEEAKAA